MKKTGLLTAFAAAVCFSLAAQQQDIIDATELTFRSQLEQDILTAHFKKEKTDPFLLFMASGSILPDAKVKESRNQFETHLEQYNDEKIKSKKNDKKTKYIYDGLHRHFLKKYEELATFEQVFYNGSYNCVSASALYALAFQKLGIPFVIKEEPTHVYLVAFPDADRVKIETTSPVGGFQAMTSNFKQSYVKSLRDQKLISQQEASSRSTDELFDKYYFNNQQNVSLENLAGIQYMNEAVENMENRKFNEATIAMEKAYLLFPTPRTGYLLMTAYSQAFENRNEKDSLHAVYLGKLSRFKDAGVTRDVVRGEFARALNVLLFEQNKKDQAVHYHRIIAKTIRDEELKRNLEMVYHFETGRYAYSKTKFKEANVAFEKAMELSPDDLDVSNAFVGSLAQTMVTSGSSLDHISIMEEKLKKNPKLSENNIFNAMLASSYLLQSGIEFDQEKPVAGDKYRMLFEDYKKKYPDIQVNSDLIGHSYSRSAIYFFRKGQTAKARSIIEMGLTYSPNNYELLNRQRMIR